MPFRAKLVAVLALVLSTSGLPAAAPKPRLDRAGEPLPTGTVARMGTLRLGGRRSRDEPGLRLRWQGAGLGGCAGSVCLWDTASGKLLHRCRGHRGEVLALAFAPGGKLLASGGRDGSVRLWDAATGKETRRPLAAGDQVHTVAFSPGGSVLAAGTAAGIIYFWDSTTGSVLRQVQPGGTVHALAFSPDGKILAGNGGDKGITLWEMGGTGVRHFGDETPHRLAFFPTARHWPRPTSTPASPLGSCAGQGVAFGGRPDGRVGDATTCSAWPSLPTVGRWPRPARMARSYSGNPRH